MNNEKIKSFNELNADEHTVLAAFREMKLKHDYWLFSFYKMQVEQIIVDYERMRKTRENIQEKYFDLGRVS